MSILCKRCLRMSNICLINTMANKKLRWTETTSSSMDTLSRQIFLMLLTYSTDENKAIFLVNMVVDPWQSKYCRVLLWMCLKKCEFLENHWIPMK